MSPNPSAPSAIIDRREALRRAALALGGALSAPLVAAVLAGCGKEPGKQGGAGGAGETWQPRALTPEQADLVGAIVDHILPETDTPGARALGVHHFIDTLLAESYPAAERATFLAGLNDLDARARRATGHPFLQSTPDEQRALLQQLDREAKDPFFRTLKELTLVGYYTSEVGATRELHHAPVPGRFDGCVPLAQIGRTWAV